MLSILALSAVSAVVLVGALRWGDAACRSAAKVGLVGLCCALTGQALLGWHNVWPVVFGDLILGGGLLWLAATHGRWWLYVEVGLCAAMLLTHSLLLTTDEPPTILHRLLNDLWAAAMVVILGLATVRAARPRPTGAKAAPL